MSSHDLQAELSLIRAANPVSVPVEMIRAKRNAGAAFSLACDASGLEDKEIYMALDLDAGTFSRIRKGTNTLAGDAVARFCSVVGNRIYVEWLAYQLGCGLVMLKSETERRAEAAEQALREERIKTAALIDALRASR